MDTNEYPTTDLTRITLYLTAGLVPLRKSIDGHIITWFFDKDEVSLLNEAFKDKKFDVIRKYNQMFRTVQSEMSAVKRASRENLRSL